MTAISSISRAASGTSPRRWTNLPCMWTVAPSPQPLWSSSPGGCAPCAAIRRRASALPSWKIRGRENNSWRGWRSSSRHPGPAIRWENSWAARRPPGATGRASACPWPPMNNASHW